MSSSRRRTSAADAFTTSPGSIRWRVPGATPDDERLARSRRALIDAGRPCVGVLALQGDVIEHLRLLGTAGVAATTVRSVEELRAVHGLIIPGGESTAIARALDRSGMLHEVRQMADNGFPIFGTCAGLVLLSDEIDPDPGRLRIGGLPVYTRRNAWGRQLASFDVSVEISVLPSPARVSFIRAPGITRIGPGVRVLATHEDEPVLVRHDNLLAASFHPETHGDARLHVWFVKNMVEPAAAPSVDAATTVIDVSSTPAAPKSL